MVVLDSTLRRFGAIKKMLHFIVGKFINVYEISVLFLGPEFKIGQYKDRCYDRACINYALNWNNKRECLTYCIG